MMTLNQAARFFDEQLFTDSYGTATFYGQILVFADNTRSASSATRRILDVGPSVSIPQKRTITESVSGNKYIVAYKASDFFQGDEIRAKYPILPAYNQFNIRSIDQVLTGVGGVTDAYMVPSYIRRNIVEDNSDYLGSYEIHFSAYYAIPQGNIIHGEGKYYRVRENSRVDDIGFGAVEAVELQDPIKTYTFQGQGTIYDPVTDSYNTPAAINGVVCLVEHVTLDFQHEALGYVRLEPGDKSISFLKSVVAAVTVGDRIGNYRVESVTDHTTFWTVQGRKVA
jgi:hypothetical protein